MLLVPPNCTKQCQHCTVINTIIGVEHTPPSICPAANHQEIVLASAITPPEPNPHDVSNVGTLVLLLLTLATAKKRKQHNCVYYQKKRKISALLSSPAVTMTTISMTTMAMMTAIMALPAVTTMTMMTTVTMMPTVVKTMTARETTMAMVAPWTLTHNGTVLMHAACSKNDG
jgi:hypothetical protein